MSTISSLAFAPFMQAGSSLISDQLAESTGVVSSGYRRGIDIDQNKARPNVLAPVDSLIALYWQSQWVNGRPTTALLTNLGDNLVQHGVDVSKGPWRNVVDQAGSRAPLDDYLRGHYRRIKDKDGNGLFLGEADGDEIMRRIRREQLQRTVDTELTLRPPFAWGPADALRLWWLGLISLDTYKQLVRAAGSPREDDLAWQRVMAQWAPDADTCEAWARRQVWDDALAERYRLDTAYEQSPIAVFFARATGKGADSIALPRQPEGSTDWLKLSMRAGVPLPTYGEAREMQHRLRPAPAGDGSSVVPGAPAWLAGNTRDMLRVAGYTDPIIDRLMGLTVEPINIRIVNQVLHEILTHPNVAADAGAAFPGGGDWVQSVYLDYGLSPAVALLAADAARAKADDSFFAERDSEQKSLRKTDRELALKEYSAGLLTDIQCQDQLVGPQFTGDMAVQATTQVNREFKLTLLSAQVKAIEEAYMTGKITIDVAGAQLKTAGVIDERIILYVQEWVWARGENQRQLTTAEILAGVKAGLITPALATARLTNLGWTAPDALIEVAQVQHELDAAAAHSAATVSARSIAATLRAQREAADATKAAAKAAAAKAKADKAAADQLARAGLTEAKTVSSYDASALLDLDAYNKAVASGDATKQQAEIAKAMAAYEGALLKQLSLSQEGPGEKQIVKPVAEIPVPGAAASAGDSADAAGATPQPGAAPATGGGAAPPPAT